MTGSRLFDDLSARVREVLAKSPAQDVEKNLRAAVRAAIGRLDLVTREEFDIQKQVLARTREKIEALEARVAELEAQARPPDRPIGG